MCGLSFMPLSMYIYSISDAFCLWSPPTIHPSKVTPRCIAPTALLRHFRMLACITSTTLRFFKLQLKPLTVLPSRSHSITQPHARPPCERRTESCLNSASGGLHHGEHLVCKDRGGYRDFTNSKHLLNINFGAFFKKEYGSNSGRRLVLFKW